MPIFVENIDPSDTLCRGQLYMQKSTYQRLKTRAELGRETAGGQPDLYIMNSLRGTPGGDDGSPPFILNSFGNGNVWSTTNRPWGSSSHEEWVRVDLTSRWGYNELLSKVLTSLLWELIKHEVASSMEDQSPSTPETGS